LYETGGSNEPLSNSLAVQKGSVKALIKPVLRINEPSIESKIDSCTKNYLSDLRVVALDSVNVAPK
jgi:hypothetical protein